MGYQMVVATISVKVVGGVCSMARADVKGRDLRIEPGEVAGWMDEWGSREGGLVAGGRRKCVGGVTAQIALE